MLLLQPYYTAGDNPTLIVKMQERAGKGPKVVCLCDKDFAEYIRGSLSPALSVLRRIL
jgi:hypothetical protein